MLWPYLCRYGKLAKRAELGAKEVQQPNANNANDAQPAKQTGALGDTQVGKEGMGKQDTTASQSAAEEVIGGEQTGSVHGVAERDVDEDALHDDKGGAAVNDNANGGNDPVDRGSGAPGKEEQADGWAKCGAEGGHEAGFLDTKAVLDSARVDVEVEICPVDGDAHDAGYENAEENKADFAEVHAVVDGEDEGEDLKD